MILMLTFELEKEIANSCFLVSAAKGGFYLKYVN